MTPDQPVESLARFAETDEINPFKLLLNLLDHAVARTAGPGRDDILAELPLSAAAVFWWTRSRPLIIYAVLRAGADPADIADATGLEAGEVVRHWRRWTDAQTPLDVGGRLTVDPTDVQAVEHRLGLGVVR